MKSGVDFINSLRKAFTHADPNCVKIYCQRICIFTLSGSALVKAACRTMMKFTDGFLIRSLVINKNLLLNQFQTYLKKNKDFFDFKQQ
jgi:hypothetical protein